MKTILNNVVFSKIENDSLVNQDFSICNGLANAVFSESNLRGAIFTGCTLNNSSFVKAVLQGAQFDSSVLEESKFYEARLEKANFNKAVLTGSVMKNVHLTDASMSGAILDKVILGDADLTGVTGLTWDQLSKAVIDLSTILPEPFAMPWKGKWEGESVKIIKIDKGQLTCKKIGISGQDLVSWDEFNEENRWKP